MTNSVSYASVAVIDYLESNQIAVEVISVTSDVCELSGAWVLELTEIETLDQIIDDRLILTVIEHSKLNEVISKFQSKQVNLTDFLSEANSEVKLALEAFKVFTDNNEQKYREYMAISPAERKHFPKVTKKQLNDPDFFNWPNAIENSKADKYLESIGKLGVIKGGEIELQRTIALSRALKFFIEKWKNDEIERKNKIYVDEKDSEITILPKSWLSKLNI
jgi:hypothetical protein